ncbi:MAG: hotdog fold domain-containing protein [Pseudomonadota bacterium]|nr:hotdog fold domain-containing protein [Pseudomonadota bacterium]
MHQKSLPLKAWEKIGHSALGRWLFAKAVCWRVPYFSSISPSFIAYNQTEVIVSMKKKKMVTNHLGTIHVIAIANLCELAAGTLMEGALISSMRWIPKGMNIQYIAKANSSLRATATMPLIQEGVIHDAIVPVSVIDEDGIEVVRADIIMYLTPKKK